MNLHSSQYGGAGTRRLVACALGLTALLSCLPAPAHAGSDERKGTNGALELALPVGPRGTALGNSVVGDATGIEAIFWNPAGLATIQGTEAMFSNTQYIANMKINYAAIATKMGDWGTMGLNAKVLSIGDVIVTTEAAPEGTGEVLQPTFTVMGVTYARQFTDRVLFGATANWVNESILNETANGLAFDFGVEYLTGWNGLRFGMAMKNFGGSMRFDGSDFETSVVLPSSDPTSAARTLRTSSSSFEMPSYFTLSASYDLMTNQDYGLKAMGGFQNNNFEGDNVSAGLEWNYKDTFGLRGSWLGSLTSQFDPVTGNETVKFRSGTDIYSGFALGAGAKMQVGGSKLGVDVAWRPVDHYFDDVLEVGLKLAF